LLCSNCTSYNGNLTNVSAGIHYLTVTAYAPYGGNGSASVSFASCGYKWWFDNQYHAVCNYSRFCGAYSYYGLRTYDNQTACAAALTQYNNQSNTTTTTTSTTTTTRPLTIYDVNPVYTSENSTVITWKTYGISDARVEYGLNSSYGMMAYNTTAGENHYVPVYGLAADTLYHYRVRSASGNLSAVSGDYTFRTLYVYVANKTNITANQTTTVTVPRENISMDIVTSSNVTNATITVKASTSSQVNEGLGVPGLNKYIQVETSTQLAQTIKSIMLKVYYTDAELNASGLNESSLAMYWYNTTTQKWVKLSTNMSWVYGTGVNTVQNYVWANVSHFSNYAVGGESLSCGLEGDYSPCVEVSLNEVIALINKWAADEATLAEVVALINGWAATL
jgi:hypothetical protein